MDSIKNLFSYERKINRLTFLLTIGTIFLIFILGTTILDYLSNYIYISAQGFDGMTILSHLLIIIGYFTCTQRLNDFGGNKKIFNILFFISYIFIFFITTFDPALGLLAHFPIGDYRAMPYDKYMIASKLSLGEFRYYLNQLHILLVVIGIIYLGSRKSLGK